MTRSTAALLGLTVLTGSVLTAVTVGAAASVEVRAANLGSGSALVTCDDDVQAQYRFAPADPTTVTGLQIFGIDMPDCRGRTVIWAVLDLAGLPLRSGTAEVSAASIIIDLQESLAADEIGGEVDRPGGPGEPGALGVRVRIVGLPTSPGQGQGRGRGQGQDPLPTLVIPLS